MHGLHVALRSILIGSQISIWLLPLAAADAEELANAATDDTGTSLSVLIDSDRVTQLQCQIGISGTLTTPAADGLRKWNLNSDAELDFIQRQVESELSGPLAVQAVRRFSKASTRTTVGKDYETTTTLPRSNALIHVRGTDARLAVAAAAQPLSRTQFDLLQMPCDPLFCTALLPTRAVEVGEKWNTDAWVLPRLSGLEAVTDHSLSCTLLSLDNMTANITFVGTASGAVQGSASSVELSGRLTLDRNKRMLTRLSCRMKEKRSAGPVSPGIDASIDIAWSQTTAENDEVPEEFDESLFDRPLVLKTPWRLIIQHSQEWHIFNQNERVIMLRQMRNGALISQCNIATGVAMPPGEHTPDLDFRSDVESAVQGMRGQVDSEETQRDDDRWRIRHIRTTANVNKIEIVRDYYLCTAASGEQFSLMFSHGAPDTDAFGEESHRILDSLALARRRPALPFRK